MSLVERFDVVIVGARCAGAPLATMLARRGLRVCLLDRARFPSETLSTHVIQPCGTAVLDRLGVLDAILAAGAVSLTGFTLVDEDARIEADGDAVAALGAPALSIRRVTLDHLLVQAAVAAGADVRTETRATGLLRDDGRVVGVQTAGGPLRSELVVGADGRRSTVAAEAGAAEYHMRPPGRLFAWAYFEGVADTEARLRLGRLGDLAYLACPTDAGLYMAGACPPLADKDAFLADREHRFEAGLRGWPELAELLAGARRDGPIRVMGNWHGFFREAAAPGWVLVGDAGHFKDPTPAQGISDALRQAERLAGAVEAGLGGAAELDAELRRWWRWRDEDAYEMYWFATDMGTPARPQLLATQFLRDVAADEAATEQLLRVLNHEVAPSQLLRPRRLARAAVRAVRREPRQIPAMVREAATAVRNEVRRSRMPATRWC